MSWDNNPGGRQEGCPDLSEMIKKAGHALGLGKGGKPLWLIVVVIVLAIFLAYTAIYTIAPGQKADRNVIIIRLSRLGWAQEQIAELVGTSQGRVAQIVNNTNFGEINNLLSQGRDMYYIAGHYQMDLLLAWALRLEGKTDQEKANSKIPSISSLPRDAYEEFFERFFLLAHQKIKETPGIAFLNADWRDFQSTPALKENADKAITIFDYHRLSSGINPFGNSM